jgi:hypothetical protein
VQKRCKFKKKLRTVIYAAVSFNTPTNEQKLGSFLRVSCCACGHEANVFSWNDWLILLNNS